MPHERDSRGQTLAAALLRAGHGVRIAVHGTSMGPLLRDGTVVELAPLTRPPVPGDIVLTDVAGVGQRLHRVVRRRPGQRLQTRGDACLRLDDPVPADAVLGRVRRVATAGGRFRPCAPNALARLLCALLLAASWLALRLGRVRAPRRAL